MNLADLATASNGFPLESDATLGFMQVDYQTAIKGLARGLGANYLIVSGLAETGANVSDGWIWLDGDLVYFHAGVKSATFIVTESWVQKANQNGQLYNRYKTKRAQFGSGAGAVNYSQLVRIDTLQFVRDRLLDISALEPNVVISGLVTSNVTTTCDISAGAALVNRVYVTAPAYTGAFPVYLKQDGAWVTSQPGGTDWIKFDPYTSQRFVDVQARAGSPVGDVRLRAALSSSFDSTGLGKWDLKGWALCNGNNGTFDMRGRVPVGYDARLTDPLDNVYDSSYQTIGAVGGEKRHTLVELEVPAHTHGVTGAAGTAGLIRRTAIGDSLTATGADSTGSGTEPDVLSTPQGIPNFGGGLPHENRAPWKVLVYIQRI